jgi:hypothetical protein
MKKLINLNVYDAKNMICVWNESDPKFDFQFGIAREDAVRGFTVPRYYIVGVFDDGSTKAAGIDDLTSINQDGDEDYLEDLFIFNEFLYSVKLLDAKAFVRWELEGDRISEKEAREIVYNELLTSGVKISDEARSYLIP